MHMVRYHGVLSAHAKLGPDIVPEPPEPGCSAYLLASLFSRFEVPSRAANASVMRFR